MPLPERVKEGEALKISIKRAGGEGEKNKKEIENILNGVMEEKEVHF